MKSVSSCLIPVYFLINTLKSTTISQAMGKMDLTITGLGNEVWPGIIYKEDIY